MLLKSLFIMLSACPFAYAHVTYAPITVEVPLRVEKTYSVNPKLIKFFESVDQKFQKYKWGNVEAEKIEWQNVRKTSQGTPLIWTTFGEEDSDGAKENTTLVLCGVHGDEITPVKFCWDLIRELQKDKYDYKNKMVVVAPLVSPDSFLIDRPTRTNAAGVDVNRNFPTNDWKSDAHKKWAHSYRKDKRKYPGDKPASEQETIFQMNLIKRYRPNKIISVHSPLTLLDYDGPSLKIAASKPAKELLQDMSVKSSGYKVSNYPIFPGSLGNWAGKENHIPTYTLELPNSNPAETDKFWGLFKQAMVYAIDHKMKPNID